MNCTACQTSNAYVGATAVECVNRSCRHFSQKWLTEKAANHEVCELPGIKNPIQFRSLHDGSWPVETNSITMQIVGPPKKQDLGLEIHRTKGTKAGLELRSEEEADDIMFYTMGIPPALVKGFDVPEHLPERTKLVLHDCRPGTVALWKGFKQLDCTYEDYRYDAEKGVMSWTLKMRMPIVYYDIPLVFNYAKTADEIKTDYIGHTIDS